IPQFRYFARKTARSRLATPVAQVTMPGHLTLLSAVLMLNTGPMPMVIERGHTMTTINHPKWPNDYPSHTVRIDELNAQRMAMGIHRASESTRTDSWLSRIRRAIW